MTIIRMALIKIYSVLSAVVKWTSIRSAVVHVRVLWEERSPAGPDGSVTVLIIRSARRRRKGRTLAVSAIWGNESGMKCIPLTALDLRAVPLVVEDDAIVLDGFVGRILDGSLVRGIGIRRSFVFVVAAFVVEQVDEPTWMRIERAHRRLDEAVLSRGVGVFLFRRITCN